MTSKPGENEKIKLELVFLVGQRELKRHGPSVLWKDHQKAARWHRRNMGGDRIVEKKMRYNRGILEARRSGKCGVSDGTSQQKGRVYRGSLGAAKLACSVIPAKIEASA